MENVHYETWAELVLNTVAAFEVKHHLVDPSPKEPKVIDTDASKALWPHIDAIVKQWLYDTISEDLLHTVLKNGATAKKAWNRLKDLFHDNKNSRAIQLEQQFTNTRIEDFSNVFAYGQALKMLADQLDNVGVKVSNDRLVYSSLASSVHIKVLLQFFNIVIRFLTSIKPALC
ncbi:uncharacterized protein LOC141649035 [Silene latifolia]|uniref:uncharacterized protein LOC141649035 n=1 Tax=Silene latifolia TaxID=37657 RepID=UPI003D7824ED